MSSYNNDKKSNKERLPICYKYALTIPDAVEYFNIGENKLRYIISNNQNADFFFMNGNKILIKREKFEQWLDITDCI